MPNLIFKRLTVASDTLKSANQFEFKPKYNLITGDDNSIGKSSLGKLLFWCLGCDPAVDVTWTSLDVRGLLEFSIGNVNYQVKRYGNNIALKVEGEEWTLYPKITGDYAEALSEILGFKALLPSRKDNTELETPPPAYYFLPFYIDQLRSWSQLWNSFPHLEQYARWHKSIIQYHTGYLLPDYFEIEKSVAQKSSLKKEAEVEVKRITTAMEIVNEYVPMSKAEITLDTEEFVELTNELNQKLIALQENQEKFINFTNELQTERQYLISQLDLSKVASLELEQDYTFAVENVDGDTLVCPICGTLHDNSLASRASLLIDKDEADNQIDNLKEKLLQVERKINDSKTKLHGIENEIKNINNRYKVEDSEGDEGVTFLDSLASITVQKHVGRTVQAKALIIQNANNAQKQLKKQQKNILSKAEIEEMDTFFKSTMLRNIEQLNATGVNLSQVGSAMDYRKLYGSGGAAESTRGLLAYFMTVIQQIYKASNEVFAPIVIDTFNQQEQTDLNYERIIKLLENTLPPGAQLILCAMAHKEIQPYKAKAHTIELGEDKLLNKVKYGQFRPLLNF